MPQKENDKKAVALGATGTGVGATLIKKTYDKGNLTGRETLFHGTSKDRVKKMIDRHREMQKEERTD